MRAAIYIRVSRGDQRTGGQHHATSAVVEQRGWELATKSEPKNELAIYRDTASGARRTKRPGLEAMMRDARLRRFDVIVVYRRDRLFRSLREHVLILAELAELKVDFVSATEPIDTTTPLGKAMLGVAATFAELERDLIAERTREGVADARRRGKRLGRPPRVDADQVRRLKIDEGLSFRQIATRLGLRKGGTVHRALKRALASNGE